MATSLRNIIVVGGSFVGRVSSRCLSAAQESVTDNANTDHSSGARTHRAFNTPGKLPLTETTLKMKLMFCAGSLDRAS